MSQVKQQPKAKRVPYHWNPLIAAAHNAVRSYEYNGKKGAVALGPRIGKPAHVINNEVNDDYHGAKLGLETAYLIDNELSCPVILHKYAEQIHHVCFPLPDPDVPCGDMELLKKFSEWQAAMGKTCIAINEALADGKITKLESQIIINAGYEHMKKFMAFIERIKELAE